MLMVEIYYLPSHYNPRKMLDIRMCICGLVLNCQKVWVFTLCKNLEELLWPLVMGDGTRQPATMRLPSRESIDQQQSARTLDEVYGVGKPCLRRNHRLMKVWSLNHIGTSCPVTNNF